jgi:AMP nucleosidase
MFFCRVVGACDNSCRLVSDQPMVPEGVKTEASDRKVTDSFVQRHIEIGVEALKLIRRRRKGVRYLWFEDEAGGD